MILWTRRIQIWQAQRKFFCQESVFLVRSPELISKRGFFWNFCLKKPYGFVPESALLTTMRNVARQNSGNSLIEVGKSLKSYLFCQMFSSNFFAGFVGSIFANLVDKYLPMFGKISLQFISNMKHFFSKMKVFEKFLWTSKILSALPCRFFSVKSLETSWRQSGNIYEYIQFKTDSFPQIFPLDLEKAIN